jgi:hypothetical protein
MRSFLLALTVLAAAGLACAQQSIRQVNFKNFTYPLSRHLLGHDQLQWLDPSSQGPLKNQSVHLVNGSDLTGSAGFTLQSVEYGDLTTAGKPDAIVVLRYSANGQTTAHYIYVYSFLAGKPHLLAFCHFGAGGYSGLTRVYADHGELIIESLDHTKPPQAPASLRRRFRWQDGHFLLAEQPKAAPVQRP